LQVAAGDAPLLARLGQLERLVLQQTAVADAWRHNRELQRAAEAPASAGDAAAGTAAAAAGGAGAPAAALAAGAELGAAAAAPVAVAAAEEDGMAAEEAEADGLAAMDLGGDALGDAAAAGGWAALRAPGAGHPLPRLLAR
jgi:hypothetical protein